MIDAADAEYGSYDVALVRTEQRRMWTGSRYVMRQVDVYDAGMSEPVEPSSAPLIKENTWGRRERKPLTIVSILDHLEEHGPQRLIDMNRDMGIPVGTLIWSLQNYNSVEQLPDKRWRLNPNPHEPKERILNKQSTEIIVRYLRENGPSPISEIVNGTGFVKSTVRTVLYRQRDNYLFTKLGSRQVETANGAYRTAKVWALSEEA